MHRAVAIPIMLRFQTCTEQWPYLSCSGLKNAQSSGHSNHAQVSNMHRAVAIPIMLRSQTCTEQWPFQSCSGLKHAQSSGHSNHAQVSNMHRAVAIPIMLRSQTCTEQWPFLSCSGLKHAQSSGHFYHAQVSNMHRAVAIPIMLRSQTCTEQWPFQSCSERKWHTGQIWDGCCSAYDQEQATLNPACSRLMYLLIFNHDILTVNGARSLSTSVESLCSAYKNLITTYISLNSFEWTEAAMFRLSLFIFN